MPGLPSMVPAQRMSPIQSATTPNPVSENSMPEWEHRSIKELCKDYFNKLTLRESDIYFELAILSIVLIELANLKHRNCRIL